MLKCRNKAINVHSQPSFIQIMLSTKSVYIQGGKATYLLIKTSQSEKAVWKLFISPKLELSVREQNRKKSGERFFQAFLATS